MVRFILLFFLWSFGPISYVTAQELTRSNSVDLGYKSDFFTRTGKEALKDIPSLGSILVWQENGLVYEEYFNGATDTTNFQVKSVTKSIVSALAGIAKDKGFLPNLQTPVFQVLPEYSFDIMQNKNIWYSSFLRQTDSLKNTLTIKHLLTMQSGFLWEDNNPLIHIAFQSSSDPVRFILDLPFETAPGTKFNYCTGASHVFATIVSKYAKCDLRTFADSLLFNPMGVRISHWTCDPLGRISGGSELSMKSKDMMKFGLLFLNEGKVEDKQIISKSWVEESTSAQVELNEWDVLPGANGYGYYWWRRITNGHQAFVASGYGGQLICVIPDLKMVIVTTCFVNDKNRGRSEIKRLHGFIDEITKVVK